MPTATGRELRYKGSISHFYVKQGFWSKWFRRSQDLIFFQNKAPKISLISPNGILDILERFLGLKNSNSNSVTFCFT